MFNQADFNEFFEAITRNKNEKVLQLKDCGSYFEITTNFMVYIIRNK